MDQIINLRDLNCNKVFERLGHLAAGDGEMAGVEKVSDPRVIVVVRLGLGQLVVVVRKLQVIPTCSKN